MNGLSDVLRRLERRIKGEVPAVRYLFIEAAALQGPAEPPAKDDPTAVAEARD